MTHIDYGIRKEFKSEFQDYLASTNLISRDGDVYDRTREGLAPGQIEDWFATKGLRIAVSQKVNLDYRNRTASLVYHVWEGPEGMSSSRIPGPDCDTVISFFSKLDVDDFTPIHLIEQSTRTPNDPCYSEETIRQDEEILKNMRIFTEVNFAVGGTGKRVTVSLHARTKPLQVSEVSFEGFGLMSTQDIKKQQDKLPELPTKVNQTYEQSDAFKSASLLAGHFNAAKRFKTRVFENDEILPDSMLKVTFQILIYPIDEIYINGQRTE